ncbi:MAG: (Fe-S)-binding protein [Burkholderiales bacterium]|nr:(Fe-S)-binding protein [Burkholderiales bacterium]
MKVGFFITCLVDMMRPEIGLSAVKLLESAGCSVEVPMQQTCCGQPAWNSGDAATARSLLLKFLSDFEHFEAIVAPSGSCVGMVVKHYADVAKQDTDLSARVALLSTKVYELTDFLYTVLKVQPGQFSGFSGGDSQSFTYHDCCSGLRELGIATQPRSLISDNTPHVIREMPDSRACCGFGGTFSLKYGDISASICDEKCEGIASTKAGCVVMGDLGCMLNIEGRLRHQGDQTTKVLHVAQVLAGEM